MKIKEKITEDFVTFVGGSSDAVAVVSQPCIEGAVRSLRAPYATAEHGGASTNYNVILRLSLNSFVQHCTEVRRKETKQHEYHY